MRELQHSSLELYPRWNRLFEGEDARSIKSLWSLKSKSFTSEADNAPFYNIPGRIASIRKSSRKLLFLDLEDDGAKVQVILSYSSLDSQPHQLSEAAFDQRSKILRRGDYVLVRGIPFTSNTGQACLRALDIPRITAPCLQRFPAIQHKDESPPEDSDLDQQLEMLTYPSIVKTLKLRSHLVHTMRSKFISHGFTEVTTPILGGIAGGATARPFETTATEFANRKISLRIAPELWLKRLVVGGMHRIFEIGPSFRNEGLDKTHNPEFTTCEFYAAHFGLDRLMTWTGALLREISVSLGSARISSKLAQSIATADGFRRFKSLDFVPALNQHLGLDLPLLELSNQDIVLDILKTKSIPIPATPSLPNLLDKLASHYLEPQCTEPTWITNIPECMSPLSKSFEHATAPNKQRVAARAELFIKGKEVVNCYEEENSPFAQRQKFIDQQIYAANPAGQPVDESRTANVDGMKIDEDYLRALEWGLPPTGGWGCGIDRLVMLFAGKEKISDVLSFGNLRAVTRNAERRSKSGERPGSGDG